MFARLHGPELLLDEELLDELLELLELEELELDELDELLELEELDEEGPPPHVMVMGVFPAGDPPPSYWQPS